MVGEHIVQMINLLGKCNHGLKNMSYNYEVLVKISRIEACKIDDGMDNRVCHGGYCFLLCIETLYKVGCDSL